MAGNDTGGRRGGARQRGGSSRENSSDLSSSTSKKKQKDRANQESREAKRAAAAVDGVIAEVKKGKGLKCFATNKHVLIINLQTICRLKLLFLNAITQFSLITL